MGKKKKKEKQEKPWCWYCDREFDDEEILIAHQKTKHFKCEVCHKRLYTVPGLVIHCMQVHKTEVKEVPASIPGRNNTKIEIFGMEGIPIEDLKAHRGEDDEDEGVKRPKLESTPAPSQPAAAYPGTVSYPGAMPSYPGQMPPNFASTMAGGFPGMPAGQWGAPPQGFQQAHPSFAGPPQFGQHFGQPFAPQGSFPPMPQQQQQPQQQPQQGPPQGPFAPMNHPPPQGGFPPMGQAPQMPQHFGQQPPSLLGPPSGFPPGQPQPPLQPQMQPPHPPQGQSFSGFPGSNPPSFPLFPGGAPNAPTNSVVVTQPVATLAPPSAPAEPQLIEIMEGESRVILVHPPDENISLEEKRLSLGKYSRR